MSLKYPDGIIWLFGKYLHSLGLARNVRETLRQSAIYYDGDARNHEYVIYSS